jgi:hypothetical protein
MTITAIPTRPLRKGLSPLAQGLALGILIVSISWGGGYDAHQVFFSPNLQTVPPWAHLFLKPLAWLPWPYSYSLMCALTVMAAAFVAQELGAKGWMVALSMPLFWELWSGQIEWLVLLGILLGVWVCQGRARPFWMGAAWMLMLTKPWAGWGAALVLGLFALRGLGWRKLLPALGLAAAILLATFVFWPGWIQEWLLPLLRSSPGAAIGGDTNGAIPWPWGLLAWLLVPGARDRAGWLRRATAAALLTSNYLRFYHVLVLLVLLEDGWESWFAFVSAWVILGLGLGGLNWGRWAWTVPAGVLLLDQFRHAPAWSFYRTAWRRWGPHPQPRPNEAGR